MKVEREAKWFWSMALLVLAYRLFLCSRVPFETTDTLRHLGYAQHAFDSGFSIYSTLPVSFCPEPWCHHWERVPYIYGPVTLWFFWLFSMLHLGTAWVKVVLTLIELCISVLIRKEFSTAAALLYFASPVSLWYVSHEGQYEPLVALLIILSIISAHRAEYLQSGLFFILSVQAKLAGVFLLPWLVLRIGKEGFQEIRRFIIGIGVGIIPFAGYYWRQPDLLLFSLRQDPGRYNPFAWNVVDQSWFGWNAPLMVYWHATFSYLTVGIMLFFAILYFKRNELDRSVSFVPSLMAWTAIKSMEWAQFWYALFTPAFLFCLRNQKRVVLVLLLLYALHSVRSVEMLMIGSEVQFTSPQDYELQVRCLWRCDLGK
jgi:Gpi18-like mannosyltransferase